VILISFSLTFRRLLRREGPGVFIPAKQVDTKMLRDSQNPPAKLLLISKLLYLDKTFQHCILGNIFGIIHVAQHAQRQRKNMSVVPFDQDPVCSFVAPLARCNQDVIGEFIQSKSPNLISIIRTNEQTPGCKKITNFCEFPALFLLYHMQPCATPQEKRPHAAQHKAAQEQVIPAVDS
jgi:hypothetical protein